MQETTPPLPKPGTKSFSEFLAELFRSFEKEELRLCVLRNYEGFPSINVGSDVDFLIRRSDLPRAIRALRSLRGIRIVGYAERHYVAHLFVEGVSIAPGIRALGLDFIWSLNWKGTEYLSTEDVLRAATPRQAGELNFRVPSPAHEAIISLLSSLLIGGWLKEKYFPKVQRTFSENRSEATTALLPAFGKESSIQLVDAVIGSDRQQMLNCVWPLRISLVRRGLLRRPFHSLFSVARYHVREFAVRCTPETLETICVSGPDIRTREEIIEGLVPMLRNSAKVVKRSHFGPRLFPAGEAREEAAASDAHTEDRSSSPVSMEIIVRWVVEEWVSQFAKRANLTLRFDESSGYDLLAAQKWRRSGWLLRIARSLLPSIELWLRIEEAGEAALSAGLQAPQVPMHKHCEAGRCVLKARNHRVILNSGGPTQNLMDEAYAAIIDTLAMRTDGKLKGCF